MVKLFYTTYISVDLEIFHAKVGKGGKMHKKHSLSVLTFPIWLHKSHVVGNQRNCLHETIPMSSQNT